jgi:hypothetical protein
MKQKRAALYVRVSSGEQHTEMQERELCMNMCNVEDDSLVAAFLALRLKAHDCSAKLAAWSFQPAL